MMNYSLNFEGKSVLITGAASGIGLETAHAFLQNGATVFLADFNEKALKEKTAELAKQYPERKICSFVCDITNQDAVRKMTDEIKNAGETVDILINNAGMAHAVYSIRETIEDWNKVVSLNLTSQFFMSQTVANEFMIAAGGGKIVNMCSLGGIMGIPGGAAYSATKGGIMQITKSLACEWARFGITVNSVCPGFVETPLIEDKLKNEKWMGYITMRTPMSRLAMPEDVAGAVLFLSSQMADYITGTSIVIDGGFSSGS